MQWLDPNNLQETNIVYATSIDLNKDSAAFVEGLPRDVQGLWVPFPSPWAIPSANTISSRKTPMTPEGQRYRRA